MYSKQLKVVMSDIAAATGQTKATVWRHARDGWFSMDDFESVVVYTAGHLLLSKAEPQRERHVCQEA